MLNVFFIHTVKVGPPFHLTSQEGIALINTHVLYPSLSLSLSFFPSAGASV